MPVSAVINHGTLPSYVGEDEDGALILDFGLEAKRDYVPKKMAGIRATTILRGENPTLDINYTANPIPGSGGALEGLAVTHPGSAATLANFAGADTYLGFSLADGGKIIAMDPSLNFPDQEAPSLTLKFTYFPFVAAA